VINLNFNLSRCAATCLRCGRKYYMDFIENLHLSSSESSLNIS